MNRSTGLVKCCWMVQCQELEVVEEVLFSYPWKSGVMESCCRWWRIHSCDETPLRCDLKAEFLSDKGSLMFHRWTDQNWPESRGKNPLLYTLVLLIEAGWNIQGQVEEWMMFGGWKWQEWEKERRVIELQCVSEVSASFFFFSALTLGISPGWKATVGLFICVTWHFPHLTEIPL